MPNKLLNFFRLRSGEFKLVALFAFLLLSNAIAQQISEITAVSNFLSAGGVNQILIVWSLDSILILFMMGLQSLIVDRFNRISLINWLLFGFGLTFIVLRLLFVFGAPDWLNYALLFLLSEQQWLLIPVIIWILAGDIYSTAQSKRLFPIIATGDWIGKLAGVGVAAAAPVLIQQISNFKLADLLTLNAAIYLFAFIISSTGLKNIQIRQVSSNNSESLNETLSEGWHFIRNIPVFRYLSLVILFTIVCDTILEFRFLVVSDTFFASNPARYQIFYSFYRLGMIVLSLFIQSFIANRLLTSIKLKNLFFAEPIGALISSIWAISLPTLMGSIFSMFFVKIPRLTIGSSTRKAFQTLVPEERRGRVSIFIDSYLFSFATLLGCLIAGITIFIGKAFDYAGHFYIYLAFSLIIATISIWLANKIRKEYDTSMLNWRLKRRQRGKSILENIDF